MNELTKSQEDQRRAIHNLEGALLELPQIEFNPIHYFAEGLCARELFMPKGSVVTGKIHTKEHLVIIVYGDVTVADDNGTNRYTGYQTFTGKPGSKRALLMHEDTLWIAIHASDAKSQEEAEATLATNDYKEYLALSEGKQ